MAITFPPHGSQQLFVDGLARSHVCKRRMSRGEIAIVIFVQQNMFCPESSCMITQTNRTSIGELARHSFGSCNFQQLTRITFTNVYLKFIENSKLH